MFFNRYASTVRSQYKGFLCNERGAVALIWGLALIPLMGMLGVTIDVGRDYYVHSVIAGATDAAAVAGAKAAGANQNVTAEATAVFYANIPTNFFATVSAPSIAIAGNNKTVTVTATGTIPTTFMMLLGKTSIAATATSQAAIAIQGAEVVLALDNTGSMAGSPMSGEINAAKTLVNILYGGAANDKVPGLYVAIVPYTTTVNINMAGFTASSWLSAAGKIQITNTNLYPNIAPTATSVGGRWMGCIEARTPPLYASGMDSTDTPPGAAGFTPFLYPSTLAHRYTFGQPLDRGPLATSTNALAIAGSPPWGTTGSTRGDNDWRLNGTVPTGSNLRFGDNYALQGGNGDGNYGVGPNLGCPIPMLPLTESQSTVLATINNMKSTFRGGTMINVGLAAAWWMISPKWRGLWPTVPSTLPADYNQARKFVVLMTDGMNQWYDWPTGVPGQPAGGGTNYSQDADYTGYGRLAEGRSGTTNFNNTIPLLNTGVLAMCTNLKNNGVTVYTIMFDHGGSASNAASQATFRACATDPGKYFLAATNADLTAAFSNIGQSITSLRLTWPGKP